MRELADGLTACCRVDLIRLLVSGARKFGFSQFKQYNVVMFWAVSRAIRRKHKAPGQNTWSSTTVLLHVHHAVCGLVSDVNARPKDPESHEDTPGMIKRQGKSHMVCLVTWSLCQLSTHIHLSGDEYSVRVHHRVIQYTLLVSVLLISSTVSSAVELTGVGTQHSGV